MFLANGYFSHTQDKHRSLEILEDILILSTDCSVFSTSGVVPKVGHYW